MFLGTHFCVHVPCVPYCSMLLLVDCCLCLAGRLLKIVFFTAKLFNSTTSINSNEIFVGKNFYLLNIWSSWCVPCRYEHEFLIKLNKEENLKIVGLNYKDNVKNAKNYLEELSNPYDISISDKSGLIAIEWGAYGVPETFLIHEKKILKKIIGPITSDLMKEIKELINL